MLDPGLANDILYGFTSALFKNLGVLEGDSLWFVGKFAQFYAMLVILPMMILGIQHLMPAILMLIGKVSLVFWAIQNFRRVGMLFLNWLIGASLLVSGGSMTATEFQNPGTVLFEGMQVTEPIMRYLTNLGFLQKLTNLGVKALFEVSTAFTCFMFFCIAAHVMILIIAYQVALAKAMIQFPLVLFRGATMVGLSAVQDVMKIAFTLGSCAIVTGAMLPMLQWLAFRDGQVPTHWSVFSQAFGAFVFMIISIGVPWIMTMNGSALISVATGMVVGGFTRMASRL